jgi:UDP-N-acetylglucosamine--dolichyl-phosphate N-acetylglucosaminephosphotransferase
MADIISPVMVLPIAGILVALIVSTITALIIIPPLKKRMKERGIVGLDWNKKDEVKIPELGGIAVLFAFPIGLAIAVGLIKLFGTFDSAPILGVIGVLFIAGMIGIIDDISDIPQRIKALLVAFAALPLIMISTGSEVIRFPFGIGSIDFSTSKEMILIYWMLIVPIAITGTSNSMNMSAGYNGLESGQVMVISLSLMAAAFFAPPGQSHLSCVLIFAALFGAAAGLNYFNGYPAVIFVGDVGTLSMGAVIGAGVIIGGVQLAGIVAIAPTFYELFSTVYYSFVKKINRKMAVQRPIIDDVGKLHPPKGSERYTLAYWVLSKKPMTEKNLVRTILSIYVAFGIMAVLLTVL